MSNEVVSLLGAASIVASSHPRRDGTEGLFELEKDRARLLSEWRIGVQLYRLVESFSAFLKFSLAVVCEAEVIQDLGTIGA